MPRLKTRALLSRHKAAPTIEIGLQGRIIDLLLFFVSLFALNSFSILPLTGSRILGPDPAERE